VKWALPLCALVVSGCAHRQPEIQVREVIREVPVPTPVPTPVACVERSAIPAEPPRVSQRFNGDAKHDLQILAPSAQDLRSWGQALRRLLDKCVAAAPTRSNTRQPSR
jgi:hypothetical protein